MISSLKVVKHKGPFAYAKSIPILKKTIRFKQGLNVLIGPNGSGKSTVLSMLARYLAAAQGGISTVTESWIRDNCDLWTHESKIGYVVRHDGQPILYGNPRSAVGLSGGAFDDDFFKQGLMNTMNRGSTGETTLTRLNYVFSVLASKAEFPTEIERFVDKKRVNSTWAKAIELLEQNFEPSIDKGSPTILLDEPESGFSLPLQARLWTNLLGDERVFKNYQVIVATHSPFSINLAHAHYIELEPNYVAACEESINEWQSAQKRRN